MNLASVQYISDVGNGAYMQPDILNCPQQTGICFVSQVYLDRLQV